MYRIDDNQAVDTLPPDPTDNIGTPGYFTGGNPGASPAVPPTRIRYWWLNMIQETLIHTVLAAGLTLAKDNFAQLTNAIQAMIGVETSRAEAAEAALQPGRIIQTVSAANTTSSDVAFNFTKPAGATKARVKMCAGGGSGGGSLAPSGSVCSTCSGGASGSHIFDYVFDVTATGTLTGTLGHGGQASLGAGNAGTNSVLSGTNISVTCPGGGGGAVLQQANTVPVDFSAQGNGGGAPTVTGSAQLTGGMQGAGVPGPCGFLFSGSVVSGQGASCPPFGTGGANTNGGIGGGATGYAAGGGGAAVASGGGNVTGGMGGGGFIEIEWIS